jgi:hypothetical protein
VEQLIPIANLIDSKGYRPVSGPAELSRASKKENAGWRPNRVASGLSHEDCEALRAPASARAHWPGRPISRLAVMSLVRGRKGIRNH